MDRKKGDCVGAAENSSSSTATVEFHKSPQLEYHFSDKAPVNFGSIVWVGGGVEEGKRTGLKKRNPKFNITFRKKLKSRSPNSRGGDDVQVNCVKTMRMEPQCKWRRAKGVEKEKCGH